MNGGGQTANRRLRQLIMDTRAADDLRSVNVQIEFVLRQAVSRRKGPGE
jgi:hypothetical protein